MINAMLNIISIITILFDLIGTIAFLCILYIFCFGRDDKAAEAVPTLAIVGTISFVIALIGAIGFLAVI